MDRKKDSEEASFVREGDLPSVQGEQSIGGEQPDPESDDSTLEAVQEWGLYRNVDEEHPERRLTGETDLAEESEKTGL